MTEFPPESQLGEAELEVYRLRYRDMAGTVPPRIETRISQLAGLDPEWLDLQERVREHALYPDCFDQKTAQLMLFGMLVITLRDAAVIHGLAARRAGASWEEMQAAVNLAYLFGGLSCANRGAEFLAQIAEREQAAE
jgi:alkylhydroperoxidase/carboxymuconolactone decarboxylase family protein YurZ